jgi:catechol 2,3-dioxygenase-like lactoylglutathione lyase family enzyme
MIGRIVHTGLVVQNIGKMAAFYRDLIGLTVIREKEAIAPLTGVIPVFLTYIGSWWFSAGLIVIICWNLFII